MPPSPLNSLLNPRSVAAIGVSDRPSSVGAMLARNLLQGGFRGDIWFVNHQRRSVAGRSCVQRVAQLPGVPDLAVLCTPAAGIAALIDELGTLGCRGALILTAGLDQTRLPDGQTAAQATLAAARRHGLRLLGPNCVGLLSPAVGLNASFASTAAPAGNLAFIAQSGALTTALLDWSVQQGVGFSHFVSLGNSLDLGFAELLDHLADDAATEAVLLYIESVRDGAAFLRAARRAAQRKPVLVVKAGRGSAGQQAAASHTGALAGSDAVYDAAFRRAGLLRVETTRQLFDAATVLARCRTVPGDRLAIVTNGGGPGILAVDALAAGGGQLATLSAPTLAQLDAVLPSIWSRSNPVDIVGDAPPQRYVEALRAVLADEGVDAVLLLQAPTAIVPGADIAAACLPLLRQTGKAVLTCWMGGAAAEPARQSCAKAGLPVLQMPEEAVEGFLLAAQQHAIHRRLAVTAPVEPPLLDAACRSAIRARLAPALAAGGGWLDEDCLREVLSLAGVPLVPARRVADAASAARAAMTAPPDGFLRRWVLKIQSPDITHKSDVGGVRRDLPDAAAVREAAETMQAAVRARRPDARLQGFVLQPQLDLAQRHELLVGLSRDASFGTVLVVGAGGVAVEVLADRALELVPVDADTARAQLARTRISRLLAGYRNQPATNLDAVVEVIRRVSELSEAVPELAELDLNPLCAGPQDAVVLDARLRLALPAGAGG